MSSEEEVLSLKSPTWSHLRHSVWKKKDIQLSNLLMIFYLRPKLGHSWRDEKGCTIIDDEECASLNTMFTRAFGPLCSAHKLYISLAECLQLRRFS